MLRAIGMTDADWVKPQVGIANAWNEVTPCNLPLDRLAKRAKEGVHALRRHHLPPSLDARIRGDLFREIGLLWRTRLNRPEKITPAVEKCQAKGWDVHGPLPADTLFRDAVADPAHADAAVALDRARHRPALPVEADRDRGT